MPIVGNLSEFPLPEVLLLIGPRTGRLRLLDVPEFGVLDIDVSNGAVQAMRIGTSVLTDASKMLDKLGAVVQMQSGMFEFRLVPVAVANLPQVLTIHDLAMKLVCHVDEQAAQQKLAAASASQRHKLVVPQPEIWMEPELNQFFQAARSPLSLGASLEELTCYLQMETERVQQNMTHLRLLGLIELADDSAFAPEEAETTSRDVLRQKTHAFIQVAHMKERVRKLSSKLPAV